MHLVVGCTSVCTKESSMALWLPATGRSCTVYPLTVCLRSRAPCAVAPGAACRGSPAVASATPPPGPAKSTYDHRRQ